MVLWGWGWDLTWSDSWAGKVPSSQWRYARDALWTSRTTSHDFYSQPLANCRAPVILPNTPPKTCTVANLGLR